MPRAAYSAAPATFSTREKFKAMVLLSEPKRAIGERRTSALCPFLDIDNPATLQLPKSSVPLRKWKELTTAARARAITEMYDNRTSRRAFQHFPHYLHNSDPITYVFSMLVVGSNPTALIGRKTLIAG
jgi:hypothetical protein